MAKRILFALGILSLLFYVVGYTLIPHRLGDLAAPSVHHAMQVQGRSFTRIDFDHAWQAYLWRPMTLLEDLVRSEEILVSIGLWRKI